MKKIVLMLLILIISLTPVLAGCDLVTRNDKRYFNTVVIRVGDEEITKEEFISSYNMYAQHYSEQGIPADDALDGIIDNLINNKILVSYAKENFGYLSQYELNEIYKDVYESINSQIDSVENQVRLELGYELLDEEEEEEKETTPVYEEYEKIIEIVDGEIVYSPRNFEDVDPINEFIREDNEFLIDQIGQENYDDVRERAFERYIRRLKNSESWKEFSPEQKTDELVLSREIDRIFRILEDRAYINNYKYYYRQVVGLNVDDVTNRFVEHVQESFSKYNITIDPNLNSYHSAMSSDSNSVFYHPSEEYIEVSHILIEFSEEQKTQIKEIRADLDANNISLQVYNLQLQEIMEQTTVRARDEEGIKYGDDKTPDQVLIELEAELSFATSIEEKGRVFNDFIYKYNSDPGMFNADRPYAVNIDTEIQDRMIKPFADKARSLHSYGALGEISGLVEGIVFEDRQNPNFDINEPEDSVFGYHILFYHGVSTNLIDYNDMFEEVSDGVINDIDPMILYEKPLITGLNKSYFDLILEKINDDEYTKFRTSIIRSVKEDIEIKIYDRRLKEFK